VWIYVGKSYPAKKTTTQSLAKVPGWKNILLKIEKKNIGILQLRQKKTWGFYNIIKVIVLLYYGN